MDASDSRWHGQRVLVTGCTELLGAAVIRELLGHGAEVVGLVRDRVAAVGVPKPMHVLYGRAEDRFRVYSALAIHEIETVFHLATAESSATDVAAATMLEAVRIYDRRIPVITTSTQHSALGVRLGLVRLVPRTGDGSDGSLTEAARTCLQLADDLAARAEPNVEAITVRAGWLAGSADRRAA